MRRPDTSKQRVWLGAGQYRNGCRNAATNAAATNAYAYSDGDAMRAWNTNAYSYSDGYAYTECNSDNHTNSDSECNPHTYGDSYPQGDTEGSADAASPADSVRG